MKLNAVQKKKLKKDGFLVLRGLVPQTLIGPALRAVNCELGESFGKPEPPPYTGPRSWNHHTGSPALRDLLFKTPAWSLSESLVGPGKVELISGDVQVVLRFPALQKNPLPPPFHVDDFFDEEGRIQDLAQKTYTALICVLLSDVPGAYCGNFTVCPGLHRRLAAAFRRDGLNLLRRPLPLKGARPLQITGRAGDAILMHHLLPHEAEQNLSPHVRYAAFFRLRHVDHAARFQQALRDPWLEWTGLR